MRTIRMVVFALMSAAAVAPTAGQVTSSGAAFRVGAARVDITPPAATGSPAPSYEHERLYVRAIVIENDTTRAALISADQGNMPEEVWVAASKEIATELKVPVQNILMSATHTHSSTVTGPGRGGPGAAAATPPVASQAPPPLVAPMLQAVRQAKAALQPARVGFGTGSMWLNVNRDAIDAETRHWTQAPNREAFSDKTVAVLKFESLSGAPIAAYINYAMHPVNGYVTLANGRAASGYVPDDASYGHYTFQVNGSRLEPGCAEGAVANGLAGMLDELK